MALHTFIFADLSGFTALTEAHGDEAAADLATRFAADAAPRLHQHGAEQVKSIGDALMIRCEDARAAVKLGLELVNEVGGQHDFPTVRAGMDTGSATERDGDWFGSAVNLAARVAGEAGGGEVLLTDATRLAAGPPLGFALRERGRVELRNVGEPVLLFRALAREIASGEELPIDPVCRMAVDPEHAAGSLQYHGTEHFFCSLACAARFAADPERYAA